MSPSDEPDAMTPDLTLANDTIARYEAAIESFAEFRSIWKLLRKHDSRPVTEAYKRLLQLWYVLYRVRGLTARDEAATADFKQLFLLNPPGFYARTVWLRSMAALIELHAESFYLFAWRLGLALRTGKVPGFGSFNPVGVRNVRNWLIEHAHEGKGVMDHSFQFNVPEGVRLKPHGGGPDRVHDAGLYPNAKEFIEDLLQKLDTARKLLHSGDG